MNQLWSTTMALRIRNGQSSAAVIILRLIQLTWKSKRQAEKLLRMGNTMETRRNKGVKKK
jgi:hypothetical protein